MLAVRLALLLVPLSAPASAVAAGTPSAPALPSDPAAIPVIEGEPAGPAYRILADLTVHARRASLFAPDPTRADVDRKLREAAARLGADAVIRVSYGRLRLGVTSWRVREGRGQAIRFEPQP